MVIITTEGLDLPLSLIQKLDPLPVSEALDQVGQLVTSQTQRRIHIEKAAPDGHRWIQWHPRTAKRARSGHSLLQRDNYLLQSITHQVTGNEVRIGTNRVYGPTHQYGRGPIPARPFLGLSPDNRTELQHALDDWASSLLHP